MSEYPAFVHTGPFDARWAEYGLGDEDVADLQSQLVRNPHAGAVIPGTGGVRKLRFPLPGRGKSGSLRVLYAHLAGRFVFLMVGVYGKSQLANVPAAQKRHLANLVRQFEDSLPPTGGPPAGSRG